MSSLRVTLFLALVAIASAGFSYSNCGKDTDPIKINQLNVSPDPVVLGKNITLSFKATVDEAVKEGASAKLKVWKKIVGVWTEIPCLNGVGSCTYSDLCGMIPDEPCDPIFVQNNVPCKCPFNNGTYGLPPTSIATKNPGLSWLTSGSFSAQAEVFDSDNNRLICILIYVDLSE